MAGNPHEGLTGEEFNAKFKREIQQRTVELREAENALQAIRGVGEAERGAVRVEVDSNGLILDLVFTDRAVHLGSPKLEQAVLFALTKAKNAATASGEAPFSAVVGEEEAREFTEKRILPTPENEPQGNPLWEDESRQQRWTPAHDEGDEDEEYDWRKSFRQ